MKSLSITLLIVCILAIDLVAKIYKIDYDGITLFWCIMGLILILFVL